MEGTDARGFFTENETEFGFVDFLDEKNLEQFIELIRGEIAEPIVRFCPNYDCEHINGCLADDQFGPTNDYLFDFSTTAAPQRGPIAGEKNVVTEKENEGDESSATTTTTMATEKRSGKGDRTRTLISERRRRGRMKEKLYALRALVPNITKMDKASIIGDAVSYVQGLQMQALKLKTEIASLESSLTSPGKYYKGGSAGNIKKTQTTANLPTFKRIVQMDVFQVEERGFYVRLVCNKGQGVAVSLYRAIESLGGFSFQSSNLVTSGEDFVLTFNLNVRDCQTKMDLPSLRLWIATALLSQEFEFRASF